MEFSHTSVLLWECIDGLDIKPDGIYVDCTVGGGGHSFQIAKRLEKGKLIGFDQDGEAVSVATERLKGLPFTIIQENFSELDSSLDELEIYEIDGILIDLGVSSHQLDTAERGFSYHNDAPLDMRMSGIGLSAFDVVNEYSKEDLERILYNYGEEKFARGIVNGIIKERDISPIQTTGQLAEIIKRNVPLSVRKEKNPCKKTFQAIRIEVNRELEVLEIIIKNGFKRLKIGGRMAIITFHSLEDRIVKNMFRDFCTGCVCPSDFPICVCGQKPKGKLVNKKPITASEEELEANNRSRSAKLRIIEKL